MDDSTAKEILKVSKQRRNLLRAILGVLVIGGTYAAGYTLGKDRALRDNRRDEKAEAEKQ